MAPWGASPFCSLTLLTAHIQGSIHIPWDQLELKPFTHHWCSLELDHSWHHPFSPPPTAALADEGIPKAACSPGPISPSAHSEVGGQAREGEASCGFHRSLHPAPGLWCWEAAPPSGPAVPSYLAGFSRGLGEGPFLRHQLNPRPRPRDQKTK